jgi:hypothetical protein
VTCDIRELKNMETKQTSYDMLCAISDYRKIEKHTKNMLRGHYSLVAKRHKVKVRDLIKALEVNKLWDTT